MKRIIAGYGSGRYNFLRTHEWVRNNVQVVVFKITDAIEDKLNEINQQSENS